jgi:hypothetical protein
LEKTKKAYQEFADVFFLKKKICKKNGVPASELGPAIHPGET